MGESVLAVDALLNKHSDFEKTLIAQSDKIEALKKEAETLMNNDREYSEDIKRT